MGRGSAVGKGLFSFFLVILAFPGFSLDWTGASEEIVPSTLAARSSAAVTDLLYKTPVEQWKPKSFTVEGCAVTLALVRQGKGEDRLFEVRIEPGKPYGEGSWMIFVDGLGRFREVRIMLLAATPDADHRLGQNGTWVRYSQTDSTQRCRQDLFLASRLVSSGVEKPYPLWQLPQLAETDLLGDNPETSLESLVPFSRWEDKKVEEFYHQVQKRLSVIPAVDDALWMSGTGDGEGSWARLPGKTERPERGLGPWGTVLWTAEAVIKGWGGSVPSMMELTEPRVRLPGYSQAMTWEPWEDPGFSLSWNRNLGLCLDKLVYPKRPLNNQAADIHNLPFFEGLDDTGFEVADFAPVVHLLAVTRPGRLYLASLSVQQPGAKGSAAAVHYLSPVLLLPWVGDDGKVRCVLFSGPREISFDRWLKTAGLDRPGVRPDHFQLIEMPLPENPDFPVLPLR